MLSIFISVFEGVCVLVVWFGQSMDFGEYGVQFGKVKWVDM